MLNHVKSFQNHQNRNPMLRNSKNPCWELAASILAVWLSSMSQQASLLIGCHDPASILAEWLSSMSQQAPLLSGCHDPASILAEWLSKVSQQASLLSGCQV